MEGNNTCSPGEPWEAMQFRLARRRNCCKDLLLEGSSSLIRSHPLEPDALHTDHWAIPSSGPSDPIPDIQRESEGKTGGVLFKGQGDLRIFILSFT